MRPPKGMEPSFHAALIEAGWTHTWSRKAHNRYLPPKGGTFPDGVTPLPTFFTSSSPSDVKSKYAVRAQLKRFGVSV